MQEYLDLVRDVLENGSDRLDRTGVGTRALFGAQLKFDLRKGFPLITTKKVHFKSIVVELLFFLSGSTNTKFLEDNKVTIWREWQDKEGNLNKIYSYQWRSWGGHLDQIQNLVTDIKNNPNSRRHIVTAWNPEEIHEMALPPCHMFFQCFVDNGFLDLQMYQRSADIMLGVPFNIASYALLTHMLAQVCGLQPRYFIHTFGDYHIYTNHFEGAREQLKREPRPLPKLILNPEIKNMFDFKLEDVKLEGYNPHPKIIFEVAV